MKTFKDIAIGNNFYLEGCLGVSRWLKVSDTMARLIATKPLENRDGNGRFELNQQKPFLETQKVIEL